jgi:hypothetical protein
MELRRNYRIVALRIPEGGSAVTVHDRAVRSASTLAARVEALRRSPRISPAN